MQMFGEIAMDRLKSGYWFKQNMRNWAPMFPLSLPSGNETIFFFFIPSSGLLQCLKRHGFESPVLAETFIEIKN